MTTIAAAVPPRRRHLRHGRPDDRQRARLAGLLERVADEFALGLDEEVFLHGRPRRPDSHALLRAQGIEDSVIRRSLHAATNCTKGRTQTGLPLRPGILELLELLKARGTARGGHHHAADRVPTASWRRPDCCRISTR